MKKINIKLLIKVPILHTKEDMGSLGHRLVIDNGYHSQAYDYWQKVATKIKSLPYDFRKIKVYQDGLPDTRLELVEKIVGEVESPNYELLRWLKSQGAVLMGTEDPNLIKEEYDLLRAIFEAKDEMEKIKAQRQYQKKAGFLLSLRDAYIASRIDKTLNKDDLGILFIGAAHAIETKLPKDIQVKIL